jgi:hypothetical protein
MDRLVEILLGSQKNSKSINVDNYERIELFNNVSELTEYDVFDRVNATEVFDNERENNANYRIYGRIEYMSMLNNLKIGYTSFSDFYKPQTSSNRYNILNSFQFYLVRPASSGYTKITGSLSSSSSSTTATETVESGDYIRYFQVVATPNDFELYPVGFSNNVYGEQTYAFNFNRDFDVNQYFDRFGFPLTELFLFPCYIKRINGNNVTEVMSGTTWDVNGNAIKFLFPSVPVILLNHNDYVQISTGTRIGDLITYDKENFQQTQKSEQTFYIMTECKNDSNVSTNVIWKYNPFIPLRLRYFANELNTVNSGSTSYDDLMSKPEYATLIDNDGNYVWRDILPQGYKDPFTGIGVDYPFMNKRRYLFSPIVFSIIPDLNDNNTKEIFSNIWFSRFSTNLNINMKTNDDLKNAGKPCGG